MTRTFADLGRGTGVRFPEWNRPTWVDNSLARRVLAGALVALAGILFLRGDPGAERKSVVVAAHDLPPGRLLEANDLRSARQESGALPGAVDDPTILIGATSTGAMRAGRGVHRSARRRIPACGGRHRRPRRADSTHPSGRYCGCRNPTGG